MLLHLLGHVSELDHGILCVGLISLDKCGGCIVLRLDFYHFITSKLNYYFLVVDE